MYYPVKLFKNKEELVVCFPDLRGDPEIDGTFKTHDPSVKIIDVNAIVQETSLAFDGFVQQALSRGFSSFPKPSIELEGELLMPISAMAVRIIEQINSKGV